MSTRKCFAKRHQLLFSKYLGARKLLWWATWSLMFTGAGGSMAAERITLGQLVGQAMLTNPQISSKALELRSAQETVTQAKWQFAPTLSVSSDEYKGRSIGKYEVSQPVWRGGALTANLDQARAGEVQSEQALAESKQSIALQVVSAYGDWLKAFDRRVSAIKNLDAHTRLLRLVTERAAHNVSAKTDVDLVHSRITQARADLISVEAELKSALLKIRQLTGVEISSDAVAITRSGGDFFSLDDLLDRANQINPTLKKAKAQVDAASAQVAAKQSVLSPKLSIVAQRTYGDYIIQNYPSSDRLMLRLEMSTDAGLSSLSAISSASEHREAMKQEVVTAERDIDRMVRQFWELYLSQKASVAEIKQSVDMSILVSESYERQFYVGRRNWLDVLNAVREVSQNERSLAEINSAMVVSGLSLKILADGPEVFQ